MRDAAFTHTGTAAWSVPRTSASAFPAIGSHLQRYAQVLNCAEINSSFHRSHRVETYAKWASQTPPGFRFSVKVPRTITHDGALRATREPLMRFLAEASGLGDRLAVLLVQLPPSMVYEGRVARRFFGLLTGMFNGAVVCEPRHESWFTPAADRLLISTRIGRVGTDPSRWPVAAMPGGWLGTDGDGVGSVVYQRWHGSPRVYWSGYDDDWLQARAAALKKWPDAADCWCIFDNTAAGEATGNALRLQALLTSGPAATA